VKESERLDVVPGWTRRGATRAGNRDNLITWGWTDHVLEIRPETVEEGMAAVAAAMEILQVEKQLGHYLKSVIEVQPFNQYQRNRFYLP
jgi:hypothetical protein